MYINLYKCICIIHSPARGRPASSKAEQAKGQKEKALNSESIVFNDTHVGNVTNVGDVTAKLANIGRSKSTEHRNQFDVLYRPREIYRYNVLCIYLKKL